MVRVDPVDATLALGPRLRGGESAGRKGVRRVEEQAGQGGEARRCGAVEDGDVSQKRFGRGVPVAGRDRGCTRSGSAACLVGFRVHGDDLDRRVRLESPGDGRVVEGGATAGLNEQMTLARRPHYAGRAGCPSGDQGGPVVQREDIAGRLEPRHHRAGGETGDVDQGGEAVAGRQFQLAPDTDRLRIGNRQFGPYGTAGVG